MGIYLNSKNDLDGSKSVIIKAIKSLRPITREYAKTNQPTKGNAFLCLIDNLTFKALGVLYSARERDAFCASYPRPMSFFEVPIAEILPFLKTEDAKSITFGQ